MDRHEVSRWLKAHNLPNGRDSLYRLMREHGFPPPVVTGRRGDWDEAAMAAWIKARRDREAFINMPIERAASWFALTSLEDARHIPAIAGQLFEWASAKSGDDPQRFGLLIVQLLDLGHWNGPDRSKVIRLATEERQRRWGV